MTLLETAPPNVRRAPTSPPVLPPPRLVASAGRRSMEMLLTDLRVEVEVAGLAAEVTLLLTFRNPHKRELQGELLFPLPDGATVCGYGLDVGGEMADASLVERHHARRAFEAEVRKVAVIDPGLVEHVRGNVFRTRVYPLPANGRRQVKLQYVTALSVTEGSAVLDVPLATTGRLQTFDARVTVAGVPGATLAGDAWADAGFVSKGGGRLVAEVHRRDAVPEVMRVVLPAVPATTAVVELADGGGRYFALHHLVPPGRESRDLVEAVRSLRLLWDASLSRASADLGAEFEVIRRVLARLGDVDVELVTFRHEPEPARTFRITDGDASPLLEHLRALACDGGTRLSALADLLRDGGGHAFTLLCSDGIGTLDGPDESALTRGDGEGAWPGAAPVFAVTAARQANHALLRHVAQRTGGLFVDLTSTPAEQAAERVGRRPYVLLSAEATEGEVAELLPTAPVPAHGSLLLTGRLLSPRATLRLTLGYVGRDGSDEVVDTIECVTDGSAAVPGRVVPRLWAQQQVAALAAAGDEGGPRMLELGRRFGLVTPGTSLLVLETLWQHLAHEVEPAPSRTKLYQEYQQAVSSRLSRAGGTPGSGPSPAPGAADLATRRELLRFYARLSLGEGEDLEWVADRTEGLTAAQVVELVDGAVFLARSAGRTKVTRQDLSSAASNIVHRPLADPDPLQTGWRGRVAWWERQFPPPPEQRVATIPPDKVIWWDDDTVGFASRSKSLRGDDDDLTLNKTMDSTIDRSVELSVDPAHESGAAVGGTVGGTVAVEPPGRAAPAATRWRAADLPRLAAFADEAAAEREYLRLRPDHAADPDFYADWGAALLDRGWRRLGLRVLGNLAEAALDDPEHLRALGYRAEAAGADALAEAAYGRVLRLRPEEPQAHRDLALVLARRGHVRRAAALLEGVVHGRWDARFRGVELVALAELNALVARHRREHPADDLGVRLSEKIARPLDVDLRVVLDWNADATDLDLWVVEPTGELCGGQSGGAGGRTSRIGGLAPDDLRGGYGPEEYQIRRAMPGTYRVRVRYAGDGRRRADRVATAKVTIVRDFGRPDEQREVRVLRVAFREPPAAVTKAGEWGCLAGLVGFVVFLVGAFTPVLWLVAAAVLLWAAAFGWARIASRIGRRYRVERNVAECGEIVVPLASAG